MVPLSFLEQMPFGDRPWIILGVMLGSVVFIMAVFLVMQLILDVRVRNGCITFILFKSIPVWTVPRARLVHAESIGFMDSVWRIGTLRSWMGINRVHVASFVAVRLRYRWPLRHMILSPARPDEFIAALQDDATGPPPTSSPSA